MSGLFKCVEIEGFCVDCANRLLVDMDTCTGVFLSRYEVLWDGDSHVFPEEGVERDHRVSDDCNGIAFFCCNPGEANFAILAILT